MFTQPKTDKPYEVRFLLYYIPSNLVTHEDKARMPSMKEIINFVGSRPFRRKLDHAGGYQNLKIRPESVTDSSFCCHIAIYDCLVRQGFDCNTSATMMRAMHSLFVNIKDVIIYLYDILITNHNYE